MLASSKKSNKLNITFRQKIPKINRKAQKPTRNKTKNKSIQGIPNFNFTLKK